MNYETADQMSEDCIRLVRTNGWSGDEFGNEWHIHYALFKCVYRDENGHVDTVYELFTDDGKGNGDFIARGRRELDMTHLMSLLGEVKSD